MDTNDKLFSIMAAKGHGAVLVAADRHKGDGRAYDGHLEDANTIVEFMRSCIPSLTYHMAASLMSSDVTGLDFERLMSTLKPSEFVDALHSVVSRMFKSCSDSEIIDIFEDAVNGHRLLGFTEALLIHELDTKD